MARAVPRYNRRSSLSPPTTTTDDDSDDHDETSEHGSSPSEPVRFLTPQKYRRVQQAQQVKTSFQAKPTHRDETFDDYSTASQRTDYSLTPSQFRLRTAFSSNSFARRDEETSRQRNRSLLYNRFPIVVGEFILTEKPGEDKSIYNYQPKHTEVPLIYKGIAHGSEVQQRALNEMKQLVQQRSRTSSAYDSSPALHEKRYLPSCDAFPNRLQSTRNQGPANTRPRDSLYESLRRHSQSSFSLNGTSSFIVEAPYQRFTPPSSMYLELKDDRYYFGTGLDDASLEEEEFLSAEKHSCIDHRPTCRLRTFNAPMPHVVLAEVTDVGTGTDDAASEPHQFVPSGHSTKRLSYPVSRIEPKGTEKPYRPTTSTVESSSDRPSSITNFGNYYETRSFDDNRSLRRVTEYKSEEEAEEIAFQGEKYHLARESDGQASKKRSSGSSSSSAPAAVPTPPTAAGKDRRFKQNPHIDSPPYQPFEEISLPDVSPQNAQASKKPTKSRSGFFGFFRTKKSSEDKKGGDKQKREKEKKKKSKS